MEANLSSSVGSTSNNLQNEHPHSEGIRIVKPEEFDSGTAQTPGSKRVAAIPGASSFKSQMWEVSSL
jgi:hypothetical protein